MVFLLSALGRASMLLKEGDILLQPLDCWACSLIEIEENTIYSHMGIVVSENPVLVAEAYHPAVRVISLEEYLAKTQKGQRNLVLRFIKKNRSQGKKLLEEVRAFSGKKYDSLFLWDNVDEQGEELLYCSEFISKLMEPIWEVDLPIKRMHFVKNRDEWSRYFRGKIPDREWGNSPGDFERSNLFYKVGEL